MVRQSTTTTVPITATVTTAPSVPATADVNAAAATTVSGISGLPTVDLNSMTEQQRANYEDRLFGRHHYDSGYEYVDDEVHKAYCACGEWIYAAHNYEDVTIDGKKHEKCSLCEYH